MNKKRENDSVRQKGVAFKRRRLELKNAKSTQVFTSEIKEGTMYQSGVDLSNDDITSFEEIPDHVSIPNSTSLVTVDPTPNCSFLYFDLETTGFGPDADIVQLACVCGEESFNRIEISFSSG
ncbi:uncharacterized protein LOC144622581 [Crassostrea virginica]